MGIVANNQRVLNLKPFTLVYSPAHRIVIREYPQIAKAYIVVAVSIDYIKKFENQIITIHVTAFQLHTAREF